MLFGLSMCDHVTAEVGLTGVTPAPGVRATPPGDSTATVRSKIGATAATDPSVYLHLQDSVSPSEKMQVQILDHGGFQPFHNFCSFHTASHNRGPTNRRHRPLRHLLCTCVCVFVPVLHGGRTEADGLCDLLQLPQVFWS